MNEKKNKNHKKEQIQIARLIFLNSLDSMKRILDLIAFKVDKKSSDYKYYRKEIMNYTYRNLKKLFKTLKEAGVIKRCPNKCNPRQGFKKCLCGGSGFINAEK